MAVLPSLLGLINICILGGFGFLQRKCPGKTAGALRIRETGKD